MATAQCSRCDQDGICTGSCIMGKTRHRVSKWDDMHSAKRRYFAELHQEGRVELINQTPSEFYYQTV